MTEWSDRQCFVAIAMMLNPIVFVAVILFYSIPRTVRELCRSRFVHSWECEGDDPIGH